jgi:exodeoxyribonuclease VII large subunit
VRRQENATLRSRAALRLETRLHRAGDEAEHLRRQVVALSPQSTLERGYAVVQHRDGRIVMDRDDVGVGELLRVRVARGDFGVRPVSDGIAENPGDGVADPPPAKPEPRRRAPRSAKATARPATKKSS